MKKTAIIIFLFIFNSCTEEKTMNPFLTEYDTPYQIPPFEKIEDKHYLPAFMKGMEKQIEEVNAIANNKETPTFENTIVEMERTGKILDKVSSVFFNLNSSNTNDEMQEIAKEIRPKLSAHRDAIFLNKKLFKRVSEIYKQRGNLQLDTEQKRLVEETHKYFIRSGAQLDDKSMQMLTEINQKLSSLTTQFGQNLLKETNEGFSLIIEDERRLEGLPEDIRNQAAKLAESEGYTGKWLFKPTRVSMYPFLTYSTQRDLREKLYKSYIERGNNNNERDNKQIAIEMADLRTQRANILGYATHDDFVLENTMAKTTENVKDLLDKVWKPGLNRAKKEAEEMQELIQQEGANFKLAAWDWWHYSEKIRQLKYDFSEEEIKPYFSETRVLQGAFDVATKLFDITFHERFDLPKYRENIRTFEVKNLEDEVIGIFYTDYTVRPNKGGGAWMNTFRSQSKFDGVQIPLVMNTCNFPPPNEKGISLLSFEQVTTLFHEFGHALHGLLSDANYPSLSGTNVTRDYVEFPSQMMENWAREPAVIAEYAKHYETGKSMPLDLLDKISKA